MRRSPKPKSFDTNTLGLATGLLRWWVTAGESTRLTAPGHVEVCPNNPCYANDTNPVVSARIDTQLARCSLTIQPPRGLTRGNPRRGDG